MSGRVLKNFYSVARLMDINYKIWYDLCVLNLDIKFLFQDIARIRKNIEHDMINNEESEDIIIINI